MDAGVHITSAARGGAYAEEQESGHAHAQQDGEEELGPTGRVHCFAASPRGAVEAFLSEVVSAAALRMAARSGGAEAFRVLFVRTVRVRECVSRHERQFCGRARLAG